VEHVKNDRSHIGDLLIIPVRCFSCGNVVSQAYEEYKKRFLEYQKSIDAEEEPKETPKQILDDLGVERYCCRRMIISHVDLLEDAAPYE